jgi:hypothetical protein
MGGFMHCHRYNSTQVKRVRLVLSASLLLLAATPRLSDAALPEKPVSSPFSQSMSAIGEFFRTLNSKFDEMVDREKRGQLIRRLDTAANYLYRLEGDKAAVTASLMASQPDIDRISDRVSDMNDTLKRLSVAMRDLGTVLRKNESVGGPGVENAIQSAIMERISDIDSLTQAITGGKFDRQRVIQENEQSRKAVREAHIAATNLLVRLEKVQ